MEKTSKYVKNDLFQQQSDFFSPLDRGQVKYEMLRAHSLEGHFITKVCKEFGSAIGDVATIPLFWINPIHLLDCQQLFCLPEPF